LSGGNENVRYFSSIGYVSQDAYYKNSATRYQQYNFRTNVTAKINNYISTTLGYHGKKRRQAFPTESAGSIFRMLMRGRPTSLKFGQMDCQAPILKMGKILTLLLPMPPAYTNNPTDFVQANGFGRHYQSMGKRALKLTLSAASIKTAKLIKYGKHHGYFIPGIAPLLS
jgi:hypothetical protein